MPQLRGTDVAYTAGLFEGEGCFFSTRHWYRNGQKFLRKTPQLGLRVGMTDLEPLLRMQTVWGGTINGPYHQENRKPKWVWNVYKFELVQAAIAAWWGYLSPRRQEQAEHILEVYHSRS